MSTSDDFDGAVCQIHYPPATTPTSLEPAMTDLADLTAHLADDSTLSSIASTLGVDPGAAKQAIGVALPALLGGLSLSANDPERAQGLADAVQQDHDGSIFDQLGGLLGGDSSALTTDGSKILGHLFGDETDDVAQGLSSASGASPDLFKKLLPMLAPLVMGWLGKKASGAGASQASAGGAGGISDILGGVIGGLGGKAPSAGGATKAGSITDLLGSLLGGGGSGGGMGDLLGKVFGQ